MRVMLFWPCCTSGCIHQAPRKPASFSTSDPEAHRMLPQRHLRAVAARQHRSEVRVRADFQGPDEPELRTGALVARLVIAGPSTKGPIVVRALGDIDQFTVDGDQASTQEKGPRRLGLAEWLAGQSHQQTQGTHSQPPASIAQRRGAWRPGRFHGAQPAERADQLRLDLFQGHQRRDGPGDEQVDHEHMIELAFAAFPAPHLIEDLAHQRARIDLFKNGQGQMLKALASRHFMQYPRGHTKVPFWKADTFVCSFFTRWSPFCLPYSSYLNGIARQG